jgi:hypothetical protein
MGDTFFCGYEFAGGIFNLINDFDLMIFINNTQYESTFGAADIKYREIFSFFHKHPFVLKSFKIQHTVTSFLQKPVSPIMTFPNICFHESHSTSRRNICALLAQQLLKMSDVNVADFPVARHRERGRCPCGLAGDETTRHDPQRRLHFTVAGDAASRDQQIDQPLRNQGAVWNAIALTFFQAGGFKALFNRLLFRGISGGRMNVDRVGKTSDFIREYRAPQIIRIA